MARKRETAKSILEREQDASLRWLQAAIAQRQHAEDQIELGVAQCRRFGVSWLRIGKLAGLSDEGARKRFNSPEADVIAEAMRLRAEWAGENGHPERVLP